MADAGADCDSGIATGSDVRRTSSFLRRKLKAWYHEESAPQNGSRMTRPRSASSYLRSFAGRQTAAKPVVLARHVRNPSSSFERTGSGRLRVQPTPHANIASTDVEHLTPVRSWPKRASAAEAAEAARPSRREEQVKRLGGQIRELEAQREALHTQIRRLEADAAEARAQQRQLAEATLKHLVRRDDEEAAASDEAAKTEASVAAAKAAPVARLPAASGAALAQLSLKQLSLKQLDELGSAVRSDRKRRERAAVTVERTWRRSRRAREKRRGAVDAAAADPADPADPADDLADEISFDLPSPSALRREADTAASHPPLPRTRPTHPPPPPPPKSQSACRQQAPTGGREGANDDRTLSLHGRLGSDGQPPGGQQRGQRCGRATWHPDNVATLGALGGRRGGAARQAQDDSQLVVGGSGGRGGVGVGGRGEAGDADDHGDDVVRGGHGDQGDRGRRAPSARELLIFVCSPFAAPLPHLQEEALKVSCAVQAAIFAGGTAKDLRRQLLTFPTRRFLFSGHANAALGSAKTLGFTSEDGTLAAVQPADLAAVLGAHAPRNGGCLELVFLNGCHSKALGAAVHAAGVPYVVCWSTLAENSAARVFAATFFEVSAQGLDYMRCFEEARAELTLITRRGRLADGTIGEVPKYRLCDPESKPPRDRADGFSPAPFAAGVPKLFCRGEQRLVRSRSAERPLALPFKLLAARSIPRSSSLDRCVPRRELVTADRPLGSTDPSALFSDRPLPRSQGTPADATLPERRPTTPPSPGASTPPSIGLSPLAASLDGPSTPPGLGSPLTASVNAIAASLAAAAEPADATPPTAPGTTSQAKESAETPLPPTRRASPRDELHNSSWRDEEDDTSAPGLLADVAGAVATFDEQRGSASRARHLGPELGRDLGPDLDEGLRAASRVGAKPSPGARADAAATTVAAPSEVCADAGHGEGPASLAELGRAPLGRNEAAVRASVARAGEGAGCEGRGHAVAPVASLAPAREQATPTPPLSGSDSRPSSADGPLSCSRCSSLSSASGSSSSLAASRSMEGIPIRQLAISAAQSPAGGRSATVTQSRSLEKMRVGDGPGAACPGPSPAEGTPQRLRRSSRSGEHAEERSFPPGPNRDRSVSLPPGPSPSDEAARLPLRRAVDITYNTRPHLTAAARRATREASGGIRISPP